MTDFLARKAQAWKVCNKLHIIWQSIFQGKPSLTSLERALRESSYMAVKPGQ